MTDDLEQRIETALQLQNSTTNPTCSCKADGSHICPLCRSKSNICDTTQQMNNLREHGHGRCPHCGSTDLWDDNLAYGCRSCKTILGGN